MLEKIFNWSKRKEEPGGTPPFIRFGRYSDNNKPLEKKKIVSRPSRYTAIISRLISLSAGFRKRGSIAGSKMRTP